MTEGKRPGGLTALAVINFLGCVGGGLTAGGNLAMPALLNFAAKKAKDDELARIEAARQAIADLGVLWFVMAGLQFVAALLMLLSGIGYLKQKRILGRKLGNCWAVLAAAVAIFLAIQPPELPNGGFTLGTILGLLYPVLTLFLLNTTFKEDFVH